MFYTIGVYIIVYLYQFIDFWYIPGITLFQMLNQVYTKLYQSANTCNMYILCIYLVVYFWFVPGLYLESNLFLNPAPCNVASNRNCLPNSCTVHRVTVHTNLSSLVQARLAKVELARVAPSPAAGGGRWRRRRLHRRRQRRATRLAARRPGGGPGSGPGAASAAGPAPAGLGTWCGWGVGGLC